MPSLANLDDYNETRKSFGLAPITEFAKPTDDTDSLASEAARNNGIPEPLFKSLIKQESGGNQNARSAVGAIGATQLMPETAEGLGVDPYDKKQNIAGGAKYLKQQYDQFGDWPRALAAYNAGPGAVKKYGGIPPYAETQKYVKSIMNNAGNIDVVPAEYKQTPEEEDAQHQLAIQFGFEKPPEPPKSQFQQVADVLPGALERTGKQLIGMDTPQGPLAKAFHSIMDRSPLSQYAPQVGEAALNSAFPPKAILNKILGKSDVEQGVEQSLGQNLTGLTSPNAVLTGLGLATPAAPFILAGLTPGMGLNTIKSGQEAYKSLQSGDKAGTAKNITDAALNALMAYGGAKGAVEGFRPAEAAAPPIEEASKAVPPQEISQAPEPSVQDINKSTPLPETKGALSAQIDSLKQGNSDAVLVTHGEAMPEVPKGFKTLDTDVGTWVYDPETLNEKTIEQKVEDGSHGELLGHVEPKSDATTQVVSALDPQGNELKSSMVSPENVELQAKTLQKQFPDAQIQTGGPEQAKSILDRRMNATQEGILPQNNVPEYQRIGQEGVPAEAPKSLRKIEPLEPEMKTSGVAKSIEAKAIEKGLVNKFENLAGFEGRNVEDQSSRVSDLITKDPERARRITRGEEPLPQGMSGSMFIAGMEDYANGDPHITQELVSSPITSETSIHASEMRLLQERDPSSAVVAIQDLKKAMRKTAEEKYGNIDKAENEEVAKIRKVKERTEKKMLNDKSKWESFITSIQC